jgi:hypothetical protein
MIAKKISGEFRILGGENRIFDKKREERWEKKA